MARPMLLKAHGLPVASSLNFRDLRGIVENRSVKEYTFVADQTQNVRAIAWFGLPIPGVRRPRSW